MNTKGLDDDTPLHDAANNGHYKVGASPHPRPPPGLLAALDVILSLPVLPSLPSCTFAPPPPTRAVLSDQPTCSSWVSTWATSCSM